MRTYTEGLKMADRVFHFSNPTLELLEDPAAIARIHEAQQLIAERTVPPRGVWRWRDMQQVVAGIGTRYPIVHAPGAIASRNAVMGWEDQQHALVVFDGWNPAEIDPVNLAELMVHEATHEIVGRAITRESGFTTDELFKIQIVCEDVTTMLNFVTEALAYTNEAGWALTNPGGPSSYGATMETVLLAAAGRYDFEGSQLQFAQVVMDYARRESEDQHREWYARVDSYRVMDCGPIPVLNGSARGKYFLPSDISTYSARLLRSME